jgi:amino acid permease
LTFFVSIASFFIANAVPFFKDLVSLIGALTSVPLTLLLPAIYHRKIRGLPLCCWSWASSLRQQEDIWSFLLVFFSVTFLICGVIGSLSSIEIDWSNHGPPFACH